MTRTRLVAIFAAVTMMGIFGLAASAGAAVTPTSHGSHATALGSAPSAAQLPSVGQHPANKTCPMVKSRFRVYNKSCGLIGQAHLCFSGNHGNFSKAPRYATNGCASRVWIYTAKDEAGHALCISKRSFTNYLKKEYLSFRVVSNRNGC